MKLGSIVEDSKRNEPKIAESLQEAEALVQQLTREIRTTSYLLHPPLLDEAGLSAALSWYIDGLKEWGGLDIAFNIAEPFGRLPREMELVVFRVIQECLTNVFRHSGSNFALVQVAQESDQIVVKVWDRGKGISPEKLADIQSKGSGVGIRGMRERLRPFHGELSVESNGAGTTIL